MNVTAESTKVKIMTQVDQKTLHVKSIEEIVERSSPSIGKETINQEPFIQVQSKKILTQKMSISKAQKIPRKAKEPKMQPSLLPLSPLDQMLVQKQVTKAKDQVSSAQATSAQLKAPSVHPQATLVHKQTIPAEYKATSVHHQANSTWNKAASNQLEAYTAQQQVNSAQHQETSPQFKAFPAQFEATPAQLNMTSAQVPAPLTQIQAPSAQVWPPSAQVQAFSAQVQAPSAQHYNPPSQLQMHQAQFKFTPVENRATFAHHPSAQHQTKQDHYQVIPTKEPFTHVPQPCNTLKQGSWNKQPVILPQYRVIPVWLPVAIYQLKVTSANYNVESAQQQVTTVQHQMTSDQVPIWQHWNFLLYPLISAHHQVILSQHSFTHVGEQGNEVWQPAMTNQHQVISTEHKVTSDQQQVTSEQQQWALPQPITQQPTSKQATPDD